jgi:hypothetical protein
VVRSRYAVGPSKAARGGYSGVSLHPPLAGHPGYSGGGAGRRCGSTINLACVCNPGFYGADGGSACVACPLNTCCPRPPARPPQLPPLVARLAAAAAAAATL